MLRVLGTRVPARGRQAGPAPLGRLGEGSWLPAQGRLSCPLVPPPSLIAPAKCKLNSANCVQWGRWGWGGRINFNKQCCEWIHSQLKMFYLIQPRQFYYYFSFTIFSVHNDRFFSSDDRTVICPALHLKKEGNDCSQPEGKKHTGGMWPQGRDFGLQTGKWSERSLTI